MKKFLAGILVFTIGAIILLDKAAAKKFDATRLYTVDELKEDLQYLKNKLEKRNPDLYVFASERQVDSAFDAIEKQIVAPMTAVQFYKLICPLSLVIRDGHTGPNLPNGGWEKFFGKDSTYIPLNIVNIGDRLYSTKNLGPDTAMSPGDEILSIDNIPASKIIDTLMRNWNHDGNSDASASFILSRNFLTSYSMFIGKPEGYTVVFLHDSASVTHYFKAQPRDTLLKYYRGKSSGKAKAKPAGIRLVIDSATSSARLIVPSFDRSAIRKAYHQNYYSEIRHAFREIEEKKVQHLILDLRGNGGGDSRAAKYLLRHLMDSTFVYSEECLMVRKSKCRDSLCRVKDRRLPGAGLGKTHPASHVYSGELYVLIDGGTFSASCLVSSCLRTYDRAIFVGTETGGQQYRSGGYQARNSFTLPNTKIRFATSNVMTIIRVNAPDTGRGIIPDYIIQPTVFDYIERKDTVLNYTMDLIRSGRK